MNDNQTQQKGGERLILPPVSLYSRSRTSNHIINQYMSLIRSKKSVLTEQVMKRQNTDSQQQLQYIKSHEYSNSKQQIRQTVDPILGEELLARGSQPEQRIMSETIFQHKLLKKQMKYATVQPKPYRPKIYVNANSSKQEIVPIMISRVNKRFLTESDRREKESLTEKYKLFLFNEADQKNQSQQLQKNQEKSIQSNPVVEEKRQKRTNLSQRIDSRVSKNQEQKRIDVAAKKFDKDSMRQKKYSSAEFSQPIIESRFDSNSEAKGEVETQVFSPYHILQDPINQISSFKQGDSQSTDNKNIRLSKSIHRSQNSKISQFLQAINTLKKQTKTNERLQKAVKSLQTFNPLFKKIQKVISVCLLRIGRLTHKPAQLPLYQKDVAYSYFYIILSGKVKIYGSNHMHKFCEAGQTLLEQIIFQQSKNRMTPVSFQKAKVMEESWLLKIEFEELNKLEKELIKYGFKRGLIELKNIVKRNHIVKNWIRNKFRLLSNQ